jgi:hypothetical protein
MNPARNKHAKKRGHARVRVAVCALILIAVVLAIVFLRTPSSGSSADETNPSSVVSSSDPKFKEFTDHYLAVMKNLDSSSAGMEMASRLNSSYNQTDLFAWEHSQLTFKQDQIGWYEDPNQILNSKDGICMQWSIVYVSACMSLGYQSRLVVAADSAYWQFIHVWAEDYVNGSWVHVDPSDSVWNNPMRYQDWDWGKDIGSTVKIYAFEDGRYVDVTSNYVPH